MDVFVAEHALKHGLSEDEIVFAWQNFARKQHRSAPQEDRVIAVGFSQDGKLIQMVGIDKPFGTLIYHAMTPPTDGFLRELGLIR